MKGYEYANPNSDTRSNPDPDCNPVNFLSFVFVISAVHLAFHFKVDCFLSQVLMNLILCLHTI